MTHLLPGLSVKRFSFLLVWFVLTQTSLMGQGALGWYSESQHDGITIQNSFPKGGRYPGPVKEHFNHSYLVFFTRIVNERTDTVALSVHFSADSVAIPHSPDTFVKLFLPADTMTLDKQSEFSYGLTELASLDEATSFERHIPPGEDCLFYVVALFYQTKAEAWQQERGGNRAAFSLKGEELFFQMAPQIESLSCGRIR